jgi:effector-binding domain-containing protein
MRDLPMYEVYRNSPADVPPEQLLTEIHMALV